MIEGASWGSSVVSYTTDIITSSLTMSDVMSAGVGDSVRHTVYIGVPDGVLLALAGFSALAMFAVVRYIVKAIPFV